MNERPESLGEDLGPQRGDPAEDKNHVASMRGLAEGFSIQRGAQLQSLAEQSFGTWPSAYRELVENVLDRDEAIIALLVDALNKAGRKDEPLKL